MMYNLNEINLYYILQLHVPNLIKIHSQRAGGHTCIQKLTGTHTLL